MGEYSAAHYQQDVVDEINRQHQVYFYGPGFDLYDPNDTTDDIIAKSSFNSPDLICVGHAWLIDAPNCDVDRHPKLNLGSCLIPKVMILNKEYTNFEQKLSYINDNKIALVFSHLANIENLVSNFYTRFISWPFAANHRNFHDYGFPKIFDLMFTGVLRNPTLPETQTDFRIRVQRKLFYSLGDLRLLKKYRYKKLNLYWQGRPASKFANKLNDHFSVSERHSVTEYAKLLSKSRICLNSLSPMNLISPRYFESMACKCLALCQESSLYEGLFEPDKHCITLKDDLSDFEQKLNFCLNEHDAIKHIVETAYLHVLASHTWEKRVKQFTDSILALV